jgi:hypothetical protein
MDTAGSPESLGKEVVGEAMDPNGVRVVLLRRIWMDKVIMDHPEVAPFIDLVLATVSKPSHIGPDPSGDDRRRYYMHGVGPSNWFLVVVSYEQVPVRIVSAFATRKDPPTWKP